MNSETTATQPYAYDAFISYSHRDMADACSLQKRLESFSIPKDMRGERPEKAHLKVFRDQTDLSGVELTESLRKELEASDYLLVICSPHSAASVWVNEEVRYFVENGRAGHVIPYIVDGEPESDDPALECYPEMMRSTGDSHFLGANVQEIGKTKAILKVIAIILGVRFNRLVDREKQRKRRLALSIGGTAAAVLLVISALLIRNALISRRNHELSYNIYLAAMADSFQHADSLEQNLENVDIDRLTSSAKEGNPDAMFLLASCYENGWGTDVDMTEACSWFTKGAEAGDTASMVAAAYCLQLSGSDEDLEKAFAWRKKAAEAGDVSGMVTLGFSYEDGLGTPANPEEAYKWYHKAAEAGYDEGMMQVTRCLSAGIGTGVDWEEAFVWMTKLAEGGNTTAMYNLALMYQAGKGTEEDPQEAYAWFRKAALAGDADAAYMVGWCTENNYGTDDAAEEWYRQAAELGSEEAQKKLAEP